MTNSKATAQVQTRGLSMFGRVGLKKTLLFQEIECDPVPELYFTPEIRIIGYRLSLWKYVDRMNSFIRPVRCLLWLLVFSVLFAWNVSECLLPT